MPWGVLLDLDDTLVMSSPLEPLRRRRRWAEVYQSFHLTRLVPGTRRFLRALKGLAYAGVVSNAPRQYAESLLRHHSLELPVLVAYHDVTRPKPHPEPILLAASRLGLLPDQCICIGDSLRDLLAARHAGCRAIVVTWGPERLSAEAKHLATSVCDSWDEVLAVIQDILSGDG